MEYLREEGRMAEREKNFEIYCGMIQDGIVPIDQIAERMGDSKEEFVKWYQKRENKQ